MQKRHCLVLPSGAQCEIRLTSTRIVPHYPTQLHLKCVHSSRTAAVTWQQNNKWNKKWHAQCYLLGPLFHLLPEGKFALCIVPLATPHSDTVSPLCLFITPYMSLPIYHSLFITPYLSPLSITPYLSPLFITPIYHSLFITPY
jgi:hypothetical protein